MCFVISTEAPHHLLQALSKQHAAESEHDAGRHAGRHAGHARHGHAGCSMEQRW